MASAFMNFRWDHSMIADCGIYCIENLVTGYCYFGQSKELHTVRLEVHKKALIKGTHSNKFMQNSFNRHGLDNFSFKVVLYCEPWELTRYEVVIEHAHKPYNYNMRPCADSNKGIKFSEETRTKMHNTALGNTYSKGRKYSEETKAKITAANIGNKHNLGRLASDATKLKMSIARKAYWDKRRACAEL